MTRTDRTSTRSDDQTPAPIDDPSPTVAAGCLIGAGAAFVLYPITRPFADETTLEGAASFTEPAWVLSHTLGMVAFVLLAVGLAGLRHQLRTTAAARPARWAATAGWIAAAALLPYYGAETFGLRAIGQEAIARSDLRLVDLAELVRFGPGMSFMALGLGLLALSGVLLAVSLWRSGEPGRAGRPGRPGRWSGLPLAVGLVLYLPQFFFGQSVRILHGALVGVGCLLLARWVRSRPR